MKDLIIIGAGDTGRELVDLVERINAKSEEWNILGFVDGDSQKIGKEIEGFPVLGDIDFLNSIHDTVYVVCSIGSGIVKKKIISKIQNPNVKYASLVDPNVLLCKGSSYGQGCIIYAGTVLALNATLRDHIYISLNCTIGHDTIIDSYSSVFPGVNISGRVIIGEGSVVGTGTKIIQGKNIAPFTITGAGAVVVRDIEEAGTYVGVPARSMAAKNKRD